MLVSGLSPLILSTAPVLNNNDAIWRKSPLSHSSLQVSRTGGQHLRITFQPDHEPQHPTTTSKKWKFDSGSCKRTRNTPSAQNPLQDHANLRASPSFTFYLITHSNLCSFAAIRWKRSILARTICNPLGPLYQHSISSEPFVRPLQSQSLFQLYIFC